MLDEQFGQNMMVMKESMSKQHTDTQNTLREDLKTAKQQVRTFVAHWFNSQPYIVH